MRNSRLLSRSRPSASPRGVKRKPAGRALWPWFKRGVAALFFVLVGYLLVSQARTIEWGKVLSSLQHYPLTAVWGAAALAACSFMLYSCFDLLGRSYTGHTLGTPTVMMLTFVSYAFNLNLGSVVGGIAFRYRLYSRLGLDYGVITRILSLSLLTNWMGYLLLAGAVFSLQPPALPAQWLIDASQLRLIGIVLLAIAAAYLGACAFSRQRTLHWRGQHIELPSLRLAVLQMCMGTVNWLLVSGIAFVLLQHRIEFPAVVGVLLLAAIAGVITHIPAGLGVLEAVFVALLSHRMPQHELLAALVAYRLVYYLLPLGIAALVYLIMEARAKMLANPAGTTET